MRERECRNHGAVGGASRTDEPSKGKNASTNEGSTLDRGPAPRQSDDRSPAPFGARTSMQIVLIGLSRSFGETLQTDAIRLGHKCHEITIDGTFVSILRCIHPRIVLVNLDVSQSQTHIEICSRELGSGSAVIGITDVPCLLRASRAVRHGASFVLARPTTLSQIIATLEGAHHPDQSPMSLDRAIWEYLNQTLVETGSISGLHAAFGWIDHP
jgi:ActR/RegA family two-component response regulator